jgi:branched-subunit amino acid aminotransferase/4-amino-4-deoxychorismate lyase
MFMLNLINGQPSAECFTSWQEAPEPLVFTSFRATLKNGQLFVSGWPWHVQRLLAGVAYFGIKLVEDFNTTIGSIRNDVVTGMATTGLSAAHVRVEIYQGGRNVRLNQIEALCENTLPLIAMQSLAAIRPYHNLKSGYGAIVSERCQSILKQDINTPLESLLLSENGSIVEGAWSSFGWITPCGIIRFTGKGLPGITEQILNNLLIAKGYKTELANDVSVAKLAQTQCAPFIMSALRGIVAVSAIDEYTFDLNSQIPNLRKAYVKHIINDHL